jgi:tetratricopeptide (TPR) repeat protein
MPDASVKPVIFISYSHKDRRWLEFVQGHLQVAVTNDHFETWDDRRIEGGADWAAEIDAALRKCTAFILLVSRHSLISSFILKQEVKAALEAHWARGVRIYPIVVQACHIQAVPWLTKMNIRPRDAKALALYPPARRDEVMASLAAEIGDIVRNPSTNSATPSQTNQLINYTGLPETAYEHLVGRDAELTRLDEAWADRNTNILSLVAEGGAGKSALVNEWLKRMQADHYRGAEAVLGWSFYSQGTKERATSAEQFLNWTIEKLGIRIETTSATAKGDAHPLVREWFGERLERTNVEAWRAAHGRLYEHLRDTTQEGKTPTLESLAPLYQAIPHGCRAGRHQQTLDDIYKARICRRASGEIEFYATDKLGAFGANLAAISWFFEKPYETPIAILTDQPWVLHEAAFALRAQGRFAQARPTLRAVLRMNEVAKDWRNAAISAGTLSETELSIGEIAAAVVTAEQSVAYADRSKDEFQMMVRRTNHASALHAAGRREEAERLFVESDGQKKESWPNYLLLHSTRAYRYCDLRLAKGEWAAARDRASRTLELVTQQNWLHSIALDMLTLGRAHLGLALENVAPQRPAAITRDDARAAQARLGEALDGLRAAGRLDNVPRGLLARTAFRRSVGDWPGAARDLDEVEEIAEPGPMRLHLCDMALERARLAFADIEAFAPLNGLIDESPPQPAAARRRGERKARGGGAGEPRQGARADRKLRLPPARRGACRTRSRARRPPPLRRPAAAGVSHLPSRPPPSPEVG